MATHFPDAEVTSYEHLIQSMTNDSKDRHVLAAAIRGGAQTLVTENLRDFPEAAVASYDIVVSHQDEFLLDQLDLSPAAVLAALRRQVSRHRRDPRAVSDLLNILGNQGHGCARFAAACHEQMGQ